MTYEEWLRETFLLDGISGSFITADFAQGMAAQKSTSWLAWALGLSPQEYMSSVRQNRLEQPRRDLFYAYWFSCTRLPPEMRYEPRVHSIYLEGKGPWEAAEPSPSSVEWPQGL